MPRPGWTPISLDDMLLAWALAEPKEWCDGCPDELVRRVQEGAALTPGEEADAIRWLLAGRRGHETAVLRRLGAAGYEADLPVAELGSAIPHAHWRERHWRIHAPGSSPPRTVDEFAAHTDMPACFQGDRAPDPNTSHRPILLCTTEAGPWRIAEGNHRVVAIWRAHLRGDPRHQRTCAVIVGVHPLIYTWGDYVS